MPEQPRCNVIPCIAECKRPLKQCQIEIRPSSNALRCKNRWVDSVSVFHSNKYPGLVEVITFSFERGISRILWNL